MNKNEIGERLQEVRKTLFGVSREKFAERLGLVGHQIRDIETGRVAIPGPLVKLLLAQEGINPAWLLTGQGQMKIGSEVSTGMGAVPVGGINAAEGMQITKDVLESGTGYANALWHNLTAFKDAVEREKEMNGLKDEVREMKEMLREMREMQKAAVTPGEEDKKRDLAQNS